MNDPINKDNGETLKRPAPGHTLERTSDHAPYNASNKLQSLTQLHEQTSKQLQHIQKQVELLLFQANQLRQRLDINEKIYSAEITFTPLVDHIYVLYKRENTYQLMTIGFGDQGSIPESLEFICAVKLAADSTWEIISL